MMHMAREGRRPDTNAKRVSFEQSPSRSPPLPNRKLIHRSGYRRQRGRGSNILMLGDEHQRQFFNKDPYMLPSNHMRDFLQQGQKRKQRRAHRSKPQHVKRGGLHVSDRMGYKSQTSQKYVCEDELCGGNDDSDDTADELCDESFDESLDEERRQDCDADQIRSAFEEMSSPIDKTQPRNDTLVRLQHEETVREAMYFLRQHQLVLTVLNRLDMVYFVTESCKRSVLTRPKPDSFVCIVCLSANTRKWVLRALETVSAVVTEPEYEVELKSFRSNADVFLFTPQSFAAYVQSEDSRTRVGDLRRMVKLIISDMELIDGKRMPKRALRAIEEVLSNKLLRYQFLGIASQRNARNSMRQGLTGYIRKITNKVTEDFDASAHADPPSNPKESYTDSRIRAVSNKYNTLFALQAKAGESCTATVGKKYDATSMLYTYSVAIDGVNAPLKLKYESKPCPHPSKALSSAFEGIMSQLHEIERTLAPSNYAQDDTPLLGPDKARIPPMIPDVLKRFECSHDQYKMAIYKVEFAPGAERDTNERLYSDTTCKRYDSCKQRNTILPACLCVPKPIPVEMKDVHFYTSEREEIRATLVLVDEELLMSSEIMKSCMAFQQILAAIAWGADHLKFDLNMSSEKSHAFLLLPWKDSENAFDQDMVLQTVQEVKRDQPFSYVSSDRVKEIKDRVLVSWKNPFQGGYIYRRRCDLTPETDAQVLRNQGRVKVLDMANGDLSNQQVNLLSWALAQGMELNIDSQAGLIELDPIPSGGWSRTSLRERSILEPQQDQPRVLALQEFVHVLPLSYWFIATCKNMTAVMQTLERRLLVHQLAQSLGMQYQELDNVITKNNLKQGLVALGKSALSYFTSLVMFEKDNTVQPSYLHFANLVALSPKTMYEKASASGMSKYMRIFEDASAEQWQCMGVRLRKMEWTQKAIVDTMYSILGTIYLIGKLACAAKFLNLLCYDVPSSICDTQGVLNPEEYISREVRKLRSQEPTFLSKTIEIVQKGLCVKFQNQELALQALIHKSCMAQQIGSNEALEFLGDKIVALIIWSKVFEMYENAIEWDLQLVSEWGNTNQTFAYVAVECKIHHALQFRDVTVLKKSMKWLEDMRSGDLKLGRLLGNDDKAYPKEYADLFEALAGAMTLDSGFEKAKETLWRPLERHVKKLVDDIHINKPMETLQNHFGLEFQATIKQKGSMYSTVLSCGQTVLYEGPPSANKAKSSFLAAHNLLQQSSLSDIERDLETPPHKYRRIIALDSQQDEKKLNPVLSLFQTQSCIPSSVEGFASYATLNPVTPPRFGAITPLSPTFKFPLAKFSVNKSQQQSTLFQTRVGSVAPNLSHDFPRQRPATPSYPKGHASTESEDEDKEDDLTCSETEDDVRHAISSLSKRPRVD